MTFDGAGVLWSAGQADSGIAGLFHSIDPLTGFSTGTVGLSGAEFGRMGALATDDLGTIFAIDGCLDGSPPCFQNLLTVDTTTGVVSNVGSTVIGLDAIAFRITSVTPEPSTWLLAAAAFVGLMTRRRKR